jgi:hypothetical protein
MDNARTRAERCCSLVSGAGSIVINVELFLERGCRGGNRRREHGLRFRQAQAVLFGSLGQTTVHGPRAEAGYSDVSGTRDLLSSTCVRLAYSPVTTMFLSLLSSTCVRLVYSPHCFSLSLRITLNLF